MQRNNASPLLLLYRNNLRRVGYACYVHELSISHTISRIATRAAAGRRIRVIHLDIGHMRQIIPQTLEYCWNIVREDFPELRESTLEIRHIPVSFRCTQCAHVTTLEGFPMLACEECGSHAIQMLTGEEFLLTSMETFDAESPPEESERT